MASRFISFFLLVIRPPMRPLSLAVRLRQPPAITLSPRPSSVAISNFNISSGFKFLGSKGYFSFFFFLSDIIGVPPFCFSIKSIPPFYPPIHFRGNAGKMREMPTGKVRRPAPPRAGNPEPAPAL